MRKTIGKQLYIFAALIILLIISAAGLVISLRGSAAASADTVFSGDGSEESPYLIEDAADFKAFISAVNGGESFLGKYVSQTADIDFSSGSAVTPIGTYGGGHYFYGVYDGGGYDIKNITVNASGGYGGLFGALGGVVRNVNIVNGRFIGDRIGCIAYSAAAPSAKVINCCVSASVTASDAGGIAFIFAAGGVYNCLTTARSSAYLPVNGAYAAVTYNSYTKGDKINGITAKAVTETDCHTSVTDEDINSADFEDAMNLGASRSFSYGAGQYAFASSPWYFDGKSVSLVHSYNYDFSSYSLSGKGTKQSPYLVYNEKDFRYIAYAVNTLGKTFKGVYFRQEADIDFKNILMEAVGAVKDGCEFSGIYDGAGHTMVNYRIYEGAEENTALFGVLGGAVCNLGLETGYIYGNCAAGIAVNAISEGTAVIFNCYSKAVLGGRRGGGIADNFNGSVLNCFTSATIENYPAPVVAYLVRSVADCCSVAATVGEGHYGVSANNSTVPLEELYSSSIAEKLNSALISAVNSYDFEWLTSANKWNITSSSEKLFGEGYAENVYSPSDYFGTKGTSYDPYIIDSVEDFIYFHDSVNSGCKYSGRTVKQAADLDFDDLYLTPIGSYGSEDIFCGTYDGGGKKIKNLNLYYGYGDAHTALFGSLAGHVYNLGYESGTVYGDIAAGIVYYGSTVEGTIVNSYFSGDIDAFRTSGISDTFRGTIINCWCDALDLKTEEAAPLCAIAASYIYHSYSTGDINGEGLDYGDMDSSHIAAKDISAHSDTFATLLNAGCLYAAKKNVCTLKSLTSWSASKKGVGHGEYFTKNYRDYVTDFSGSGSSISPYKIEDEEDLYNLQLVTSAGETYANQYFVQTAEIDCSSISGAIPIGYLNDYYFCGRYDGRGNSIINLTLDGIAYSASAAFILHLGGEVINVCLRSGSVSGDYAAGIAYDADVTSSVKIINCIVCKTDIDGSEDGAGFLLYGREADIYNSVYLKTSDKSKYAVKEIGRLLYVYTDGEFYDDYEYASLTECYIITTLPTVENRVTYTGAINALNSNILKLKQKYGLNIVGQIATFVSDGDGGIVFGGMFSISFENIGESISVFGNEISLYFLIYLGVGAIAISFFAEVAAYIKKKRMKEAAASGIRRGTLNEELRDEIYEKFYSDRNAALALAEDKLIGDRKKRSGELSSDAARVNVANVAAEKKAAKKLAKKKAAETDGSVSESAAKKKKTPRSGKAENAAAGEGGLSEKSDGATAAEEARLKEPPAAEENSDGADDDEPLVFSIEDILGGDDK